MEDTEKLINGFITKGFFTLGDKREIDINKFFKDSNEMAKLEEKKFW